MGVATWGSSVFSGVAGAERGMALAERMPVGGRTGELVNDNTIEEIPLDLKEFGGVLNCAEEIWASWPGDPAIGAGRVSHLMHSFASVICGRAC